MQLRIRKVVGLEGQYTLASWCDADGNPRAFTCRLQKMTPHALEIAAPVRGNIGEWVKVHFDTLGKFEGPIIRNWKPCLGHEDRWDRGGPQQGCRQDRVDGGTSTRRTAGATSALRPRTRILQ